MQGSNNRLQAYRSRKKKHQTRFTRNCHANINLEIIDLNIRLLKRLITLILMRNDEPHYLQLVSHHTVRVPTLSTNINITFL